MLFSIFSLRAYPHSIYYGNGSVRMQKTFESEIKRSNFFEKGLAGFRQKSINDFPWVSLSFGPKWGLFSLKKYWNDANFPWVNVVSDGEIVHFSWKFGTPFLFNIIETSQWLKRDLRGHHGWPRREKFLKIRYSKPWNTSYSVIRNLENKIPWVSLSNPKFEKKFPEFPCFSLNFF